MSGWIVLGLIAAVVAWGVMLYNRLVSVRNQVSNAWAQIDVQLKRRHDLIPNLVEVVKDAMGYEQETLKQVIEARNTAVAAKGAAQAGPAEAELTAATGRLFALMENYPTLTANANVKALQEELTSTENKIAFARQFYNDSVMANNNMVQSFPANVLAKQFGFGPSATFEVPEVETGPIKVDVR
jgi:LemA protein